MSVESVEKRLLAALDDFTTEVECEAQDTGAHVSSVHFAYSDALQLLADLRYGDAD